MKEMMFMEKKMKKNTLLIIYFTHSLNLNTKMHQNMIQKDFFIKLQIMGLQPPSLQLIHAFYNIYSIFFSRERDSKRLLKINYNLGMNLE